METLLADLRYALRTLRRSPGFTAVAVLTLAVGIGANTALFSVVHAVLVRPLPYEDAERVVRLDDVPRDAAADTETRTSYPNFADWRAQARSFQAMAAYDGWSATLEGAGEPERLDAASVSASFFRVLGVRPALGRFLVDEEDQPGAARSVVLSHGLWRERFGADPAVLGRELRLNGTGYTVVGVAPAEFEDPRLGVGAAGEPRLWRSPPAAWTEEGRGRDTRFLAVVGRLGDGVPLERARAEMAGVMRRLEALDPAANRDRAARVVSLKEEIVAPVRPMLLVLLTAVGGVLLVACVNVANLLLARYTGRRRELVVRAAMGASRGRLVRQLVVESLLLAVVGGAAGVALAWGAAGALVRLAAGELPRLQAAELDPRVLGFALLLSLATGLLFGAGPALHAARGDLHSDLREAGAPTGGRGQRRLRHALVAAEVALTVVLLSQAGLLLRSLWRLQQVETGIAPAGVLTLSLFPPLKGYETDERMAGFYTEVLGALDALPQVEAAGAVNVLPMGGGFWQTGFEIEGRPAAPQEGPSAALRAASPGFFSALRIPVVRGRGLAHSDAPGAPLVAVVNRAAAERYWPGADAVGERIVVSGKAREVVGVVGDVRERPDAPAEPALYFPHAQAPSWLTRFSSVVVRGPGDAAALAPAVRRAVWSVDGRVPVSQVRTMDAVMAGTLAQPRFRTLLLAAFGAAAFLLAVVGVYGVIAYGVAQRTREMGVRMALGAHPGHVRRLVIRQGLPPVLLGLVAGLAAAVAAGRLVSGLLVGVEANDLLIFTAVPLVLLAASFAAGWLPARRAAAVDPMVALRDG